jgi:hypothetical protein
MDFVDSRWSIQSDKASAGATLATQPKRNFTFEVLANSAGGVAFPMDFGDPEALLASLSRNKLMGTLRESGWSLVRRSRKSWVLATEGYDA